ncbi:hypothetical protein A1D31_35915 [Bradyrhizobium liaoningense]|nr:hypothetical protein A1D31_35915 [Bradyrhizobium liaoningense]
MKKVWPTKTLGEVADVKGGKRVPKGYQLQAEPTKHPYITVSDFTDDGTIDISGLRYVSDEIFEQIKRYTISSDDLYLSIAGTIGKAGYVPNELDGANLTENACKLVLRPGTDRDFLYYFTKSDDFAEQAGANTRTAAQPKLALERLKTIKLSLPPLAEQRQIVSLLDEAFDGLATAKANAEKNLRNARMIFEGHLQSVVANLWRTSELVTLADLAADITDGDHMPPPKSPSGVPFITIGNIVKQTRQIDFDDTFKVPRAYYDALKPNRKPKHGDVLYTVTGSFGIPVIVPERVEFCFQRHIGLIRPKPETNSSWLYYLLLSPQVFKQADDGATGTAQRTVSLKLLRSLIVPRVPLKQQKEVVAGLDALVEKTQRLGSIYERKLTALEALKKSVLHEAFSGTLQALP